MYTVIVPITFRKQGRPLSSESMARQTKLYWEHKLRCKIFCKIQHLSNLLQSLEQMGLGAKPLGGVQGAEPHNLQYFNYIKISILRSIFFSSGIFVFKIFFYYFLCCPRFYLGAPVEKKKMSKPCQEVSTGVVSHGIKLQGNLYHHGTVLEIQRFKVRSMTWS